MFNLFSFMFYIFFSIDYQNEKKTPEIVIGHFCSFM